MIWSASASTGKRSLNRVSLSMSTVMTPTLSVLSSHVTHDQSEAMALSDRIIIMRSGVVEQIGTPQEIYYHPVNEFVADFIGEANFLKGRRSRTPLRTSLRTSTPMSCSSST